MKIQSYPEWSVSSPIRHSAKVHSPISPAAGIGHVANSRVATIPTLNKFYEFLKLGESLKNPLMGNRTFSGLSFFLPHVCTWKSSHLKFVRKSGLIRFISVCFSSLCVSVSPLPIVMIKSAFARNLNPARRGRE